MSASCGRFFYGIDIDAMLRIRGNYGPGVNIAIARNGCIETYCRGSGRYRTPFPVKPDMLFQAGSVSKPVFAVTLLRYVDKGVIDLDADISGVLSDFVHAPLTFSALLSHTAGFNVHGFLGYRAGHRPLSLEDVVSGRGNSPRVKQVLPYGLVYDYSGGGITLAELAFTRITGMTLRDAFAQEVAAPLGLQRSGYFQPLDAEMAPDAAFGGRLWRCTDRQHGWRYHPEHAAAGLWTTPTELAEIGVALSRSYRGGGLLERATAKRMMTPVKEDCGLSIFRGERNREMAYHSGHNVGFLTQWYFSLSQDLCVAVMANQSNLHTRKAINALGTLLYRTVKEQRSPE